MWMGWLIKIMGLIMHYIHIVQLADCRAQYTDRPSQNAGNPRMYALFIGVIYWNLLILIASPDGCLKLM
jgi:hypothetical protein